MAKMTVDTKELKEIVNDAVKNEVSMNFDDIKKTLDKLVLLLEGDDFANPIGIARKVTVLWDERQEKKVWDKIFKWTPMFLGMVATIISIWTSMFK